MVIRCVFFSFWICQEVSCLSSSKASKEIQLIDGLQGATELILGLYPIHSKFHLNNFEGTRHPTSEFDLSPMFPRITFFRLKEKMSGTSSISLSCIEDWFI